jgi:hypothetical protein
MDLVERPIFGVPAAIASLRGYLGFRSKNMTDHKHLTLSTLLAVCRTMALVPFAVTFASFRLVT